MSIQKVRFQIIQNVSNCAHERNWTECFHCTHNERWPKICKNHFLTAIERKKKTTRNCNFEWKQKQLYVTAWMMSHVRLVYITHWPYFTAIVHRCRSFFMYNFIFLSLWCGIQCDDDPLHDETQKEKREIHFINLSLCAFRTTYSPSHLLFFVSSAYFIQKTSAVGLLCV